MSSTDPPSSPPATDGPNFDLTVVIGAATALIAGIGALTLTGTLGRVQRNHEVAFIFALMLVILGTGVIALGTAIDTTARWRLFGSRMKVRRVVQSLGMLAALAGVVLGFAVAIATASETERPTLDVRLDQATLTITGTVSAANLSSTDGLEVRVDGLVDFDHDLDTADQLHNVNLSRTVVGPDSDGNATQEIDVHLPHGRYDAVGVTASVGQHERSCGLSREMHVDGGTACINLPLPKRSTRPALTAAWGPRARHQRLVVLSLDGRDLNAGSWPPRPVILRAVALRGRRSVKLYRAVIDPTQRGAMKATVRVGVPLDVHIVCAGVTRARHAPLACPIRGTESSSVELHAVRIGTDASDRRS